MFGVDRVHQVARLDEALDVAIGLADPRVMSSGSGVLITGSVVTAGDARMLLKADR